MKKIFIPILVLLLGSVLIFSHGYNNSNNNNWNQPATNILNESNDSYELTVKEIDTSRPLAIGQDNNGNEYVINFGFLLNKYNSISVEVGQTVKVHGQVENNFFSRNVILAEEVKINGEDYFVEYQNNYNSNYYGNCGFRNINNRNHGHGMMGW